MGIEVVNGAAYQQTIQPVRSGAGEAGVDGAPVVQKPVELPGKKTDAGQKNGQKDANADQIKNAVAAANKRAKFGHANAEFSYHEPTKSISIKIVDQDTNEVIREIPPEETLEMISKMWELAGIMVDEKR